MSRRRLTLIRTTSTTPEHPAASERSAMAVRPSKQTEQAKLAKLEEVAELAEQTERIRQTACLSGGFATFAELAAYLMAQQCEAKGRSSDARRLLRDFARRQGPSPKIAAALAALGKAP